VAIGIYDIHENLLKNREEKYTTCAIFCDLSKTFDTIDHSILLHKLENFYGIRGIPSKLLTNYLQDHQQYTVVEGYKSDVQNINHGVSQGSTLGPLLFALYINDLPKVSRFRTTMFADDTLIIVSSNNPQQLNTLANAELQKIDNWMRINKLSLNYKKKHLHDN